MKKIFVLLVLIVLSFGLIGCGEIVDSTQQDIDDTLEVGERLAENQPTPTDINYSLERLNLIARAYWVNGQREKAITILSTSPIPLPLGYITLISGNVIVAQFTVMGKVSSLNSWLTPDFIDEIRSSGAITIEMPDVDGTYGSNSDGIFFFTTDGKYLEWTGVYLYSDMYLPVDAPIINIGGGN